MGAKTSKRYSLNFTKLLLIFCLSGPHKSTGFLALLDNVSRAHQIEICPSSVVCRPSSVLQLSQNLLDRFLSNFSCCLSWAIRPEVF